MKTISFFNPKGGVGKTTLTLLFAAYLAYFLNKKVLVIDLEADSFRVKMFREYDIKELNTPGTALHSYARTHVMPEPYQIETRGKKIGLYRDEDIIELVNSVNQDIGDNKYDYLILDFPAGFSEKTPVTLISSNSLIDLVCVPCGIETQERMEAFRVAYNLGHLGQDCRVFWNRIPSAVKSEHLDIAQTELEKHKVRFLKSRIKAFPKAQKESDVRCFVRSTLAWNERYVRMACPDLIPLFEEIVEILDHKA
ncbi:MAG: ParA family protein [Bacteroidales bacterium]|nr:ParA family protein [Bacteroidales bacterium]